MKKYNSIIYIVSLACAGLIFTGCATNQATAPIPANSGRLLINRAANFGSGLVLSCPLVGRTWEPLPRAETTMATYRQVSTRLPPGLIPIQAGTRPAQKTLTIQAGQTYSYTASWTGGNVVLVKNQGQVGASLLNRKVYLFGAVNLAVACWVSAVRWRKIGSSLRLTRKNVSSENEHVECNSP